MKAFEHERMCAKLKIITHWTETKRNNFTKKVKISKQVMWQVIFWASSKLYSEQVSRYRENDKFGVLWLPNTIATISPGQMQVTTT